jgi:hypothetical protein
VARIQDVAQTAWLAAVADMSLPERIAYIGEIEDVLRRGPGRPRHTDGDRD